jgi:BMFP domain-containing protein YqiC
MSVTEFERHQLFSWFEEHMGQERATTVMNLLPPTGWGDVATRRDLHVLENHIDALEAKLNARIDTLDSSLNARIDTLDSRLNARIETLDSKLSTGIDTLEARLDAKLESRLGELRSDLMRTLGTWLFASQAAVIAVVTLLLVTLV